MDSEAREQCIFQRVSDISVVIRLHRVRYVLDLGRQVELEILNNLFWDCFVTVKTIG